MNSPKARPSPPLIRSKLFADAGRPRRLSVSVAFNGRQISGSVAVSRDAETDAGEVAGLLERLAAFVRGGAR